MTPIGALVRGMVAGALGTAAMALLWFYRYTRGGGESNVIDWEFSVGLADWSKAPAPAQVGKRLFEAFFQRELNPRWAALTNNVMHWTYWLSWGATYSACCAAVGQSNAPFTTTADRVEATACRAPRSPSTAQ